MEYYITEPSLVILCQTKYFVADTLLSNNLT